MKTFTYIITAVAFSALVVGPLRPKVYPPKEVVVQYHENARKEKKIDQLISVIEMEIKNDSIKR